MIYSLQNYVFPLNQTISIFFYQFSSIIEKITLRNINIDDSTKKSRKDNTSVHTIYFFCDQLSFIRYRWTQKNHHGRSSIVLNVMKESIEGGGYCEKEGKY